MQYGFGSSDIRISTKKQLNQYIKDEQIYHHYLGEFELNEYMISPRGESTPSFIIDLYEDELVWRDFGYDHRPQNAVSLLMYLEEIQGRKMSYKQALQQIFEDLRDTKPYEVDMTKVEENPLDMRIRYRDKFYDFEKEYWKSQMIKKRSTLKNFNVYAGEVWKNDRCIDYSHRNNPVFIYLFNAATPAWKAYRPANTTVRFLEFNCRNLIQGWCRLRVRPEFYTHREQKFRLPTHHAPLHPEKRDLVITKSYKDVISYWDSLGLSSLAPQSETEFLEGWMIEALEEYFNLYINYDPDFTGLKHMKMYSEKYNLPYFHFGNEEVKDFTELRIKLNGDDNAAKKIVKHLMNESIR